MLGLTAKRLVEVWERGQGRGSAERASMLLAAALPATSRRERESLTVGQRDYCLLTLRRQTLGPRIEGTVTCPSCSEDLDFTASVQDLLIADPEQPLGGDHTLQAQAYTFDFRLPDSGDLVAIAGCASVAEGRRQLLGRCVRAARTVDGEVAGEEISETVVNALSEAMGKLDPQADLDLELHCAACGHAWEPAFDVASFFWFELAALAQRLLHDVHTLARTYGWHPDDILEMNSARRQYFLEMND